MSWFDSIKRVGFKAKAGIATAWDHTKSHVPEIKKNIKSWVADRGENIKSWVADRGEEHQQLKLQRQEAKERIAALKDKTRYVGMKPEQRAAEVTQTAQNMPGTTQVLHAHPVARAATAPFRIVGSALLSFWKKSVAIAPRVTPGSNTFLIILAIIYHIIILFSPTINLSTRIILNLILIFFVIILIFDSSERNGDTYRTLFLWVFILEIFIPYAVSEFSILSSFKFIKLYIANGFIVLTWIYYAVFIRGRDINHGLTQWLKVIIILFWFGVAMSFIGASLANFTDVELDTSSTSAWFAAMQVFSKTWDGWGLVWNTIINSFSNIQTIFSMRMKQATGEYYFGVVEENEQEQLGVYLEDMKASQSEYEQGEPVIVYATLIAKTLDDTVNVMVGCYAGEDKNKITGIVYPSEHFEISNLQQEELDCTFEQLTKGTHKITYTAEFNFQTIGYLKRYFADRNAIAAATRQDIDLLDEYQITDTNPVAHYTNGPVAMGIGPEQVLVGVSEDYTVKPRLAFTLDSTSGWGGVISKLNEVVLLIPEEMSLDKEQCTDSNWGEYTVDDCIDSEILHSSKISQECNDVESCIEEQCTLQLEGYHAYALDVQDNPTYTNIKEYITISCRLNVDDVVGLLEATPIATHYFYVKTRYDYQTSEDTSVSVVAAKDAESFTIPGETVTKSSTIPTFTQSESDEELQFIFYNYGDYLFAVQDTFNVSACTLAGIIAQTSSGDPNYYNNDNGQKGLMAITDALSQQYAHAAGLDTFTIWDIETNIKLGGAIYASFSGDDTAKLEEYYTKINNLDSADDNAVRFAVLVNNYIDDCNNLGLSESKTATETGIDSAYHTGSYSTPATSLATPLTFFTSASQSFAFSASESVISARRFSTLVLIPIFHLYYNTIDLEDTLREPLQWTGFEHNPLIRIYYSISDDTVSYCYFSDFVLNTNYLTEDRDVALVEDVLYVEYTGSKILVKLANNPVDTSQLTTVCSVPWTQYTAYQQCEDIPGLVIRNILTEENTLGTGMASVQLDWSNSRQMEATT